MDFGPRGVQLDPGGYLLNKNPALVALGKLTTTNPRATDGRTDERTDGQTDGWTDGH